MFASHKWTVLLVEDDEDIRTILAEILTSRGLNVVVATDGREALTLLETSSPLPDLLILDLMMPNLDGPGLLYEARCSLPRFDLVPVIVTTAAGRGGEDLLPRVAVDSWLNKPIEMDDLMAAIDQARRPQDGSNVRSLRQRLETCLTDEGFDAERVRALGTGDDVDSAATRLRRLWRIGVGFGHPALRRATEDLLHAREHRDHAGIQTSLAAVEKVLRSLTASA